MKEFFSSIKAFIKKNVFSCLCLLLSFLVCITGSLSYAKYISSAPASGNTGVGSFSCSASIDGVSALSFTNTAFWGGTVEDDKIAMNALRSINFSVNNFEVVGGQEKVSEVKMQYNLTFSAPKNFIQRLAVQLFNEQDKPMLPQIVLIDLINAAEHGHLFHTATSNDYNSVYHHDLTFQTSKSGNDYTAIFDGAIHDEPMKVIVKLEEYQKEAHQLLHFRTWDTSGLTSESEPTVDVEGGKLLPPLEVQFKRLVTFYRITIFMSNMVLPASEKTTVKHSVRLAPTDTIEDDHLAGYFVTLQDGKYVPVTSIFGGTNAGESIEYQMQTVKEKAVDKYYIDKRAFDDANENNEAYFKKNAHDEQQIVNHAENLVGNAHHYIVGETDYLENTVTTSYLELGSFSHNDRRFIDGQYVYLKRTGTDGNYVWQMIKESDVPYSDDTNSYYRLFVQYGEIITNTQLKLTQGTLRTDFKAVKSYVVEKVIEDTDKTHCDVVLNITSEDLLKYTIQDGASGTRTITETLDIEEEGLVLTVRRGSQWVSTSEHIHEPNLTIKPLVKEITNYNNVGNTVVYDYQNTDYIIRHIERVMQRVTIDVEQVKTTIINGDGNPEEVIYTQSNPLNLFEGNLQKKYLSQCYSKNYPFFVNVVFEQVQ